MFFHFDSNLPKFLKFIFSEKATKFCVISIVDLSYVVTVKSTVEISQNFVAFSEYMNFKTINLLMRWFHESWIGTYLYICDGVFFGFFNKKLMVILLFCHFLIFGFSNKNLVWGNSKQMANLAEKKFEVVKTKFLKPSDEQMIWI